MTLFSVDLFDVPNKAISASQTWDFLIHLAKPAFHRNSVNDCNEFWYWLWIWSVGKLGPHFIAFRFPPAINWYIYKIKLYYDQLNYRVKLQRHEKQYSVLTLPPFEVGIKPLFSGKILPLDEFLINLSEQIFSQIFSNFKHLFSDATAALGPADVGEGLRGTHASKNESGVQIGQYKR